MFRLACLFIAFCASVFASSDWIERQIKDDLTPFLESGVSKQNLTTFYQKHKKSHLLCLFTIESNQLYFQTVDQDYRFQVIHQALTRLCGQSRLPNVTFLVSLHDTLNAPASVPIFVMSKLIGDNKILFPDFEALAGKYQVIEDLDLEKNDFPLPWTERKNLLIWRGSGAQGPITPENMHTKNRVILCQLGELYPDLIDAGFTFCIPRCVKQYKKDFTSFEEIFSYKYQVWLDGNASGYSCSGWRFYTGSTVFKPDSPYTQWYFEALEPWIHYVPAKENLDDLVDTLVYLQQNEELAEQIGQNGLKFAREHLTQKAHLLYLHDLLWAYGALEDH